MPEALVNGARIHYLERGTPAPRADGKPRPAIVFSHGLFWSGAMFEPQMSALGATHRCLAFDHRAQGQSERGARPVEMEALYEDAAALIEQLGLGPCHFVGLSMGGFLGMRLAARRPQLIRSLSLLNTAGDAEPRENVSRYRLLGVLARVLGIGPFGGIAMSKMFGKSFLADPARAEERSALRQRLVSNEKSRAVASLFAVVNREPVEAELARIAAPTLVIAGEEDISVAPARAQRTAAAIPGARFQLIPRAGHTSTLEEPQAVTAALRGFFEQVEAA